MRHLTDHTVTYSSTSLTKHRLFSSSVGLLPSQPACGPPNRDRTYIIEDGNCVPSTAATNRLNFDPAHKSNTIVENIVQSLRFVVSGGGGGGGGWGVLPDFSFSFEARFYFCSVAV